MARMTKQQHIDYLKAELLRQQDGARLRTEQLKNKEKEITDLKRRTNQELIAHIGMMMKANAQLGEAAVRLLQPHTF